MWAVQDLSRLLHCIATWACRKYGLRCLHLAIRLGGGGDGDGESSGGGAEAAVGAPRASSQSPSLDPSSGWRPQGGSVGEGGDASNVGRGEPGTGGGAHQQQRQQHGPSVVVAVDGSSDPAMAAQASAFVNRELNDILVT